MSSKTGIISADFRKALQRFSLFNRYIPILKQVAELIEDILRYHIISFDTLHMLVTRKCK